MFNIFKKKKLFSFKRDLKKLQNSNYRDIGVNIYKNDQILVQIMLAKHFKNKGLDCINENNLSLILDFNKNRTETWSVYKSTEIKAKLKEFIYFEEPKGIHCFVKNIGLNPDEIEEYTNQIISEVFILQPTDRLRIEFSAS